MRRAAAVLDVATVAVFVAIGRASHHHAETLGGFASTVWPFAAGLGLGWAAARRRDLASVGAGVVVCLVTVAAGMALRVVAGQGTAVAFVLVAVGFLGALMVGGRVVIRGRRRLARPWSPG